jgi:hypothetical protein
MLWILASLADGGCRCFADEPRPTDDQLLARFHAHRGDLEKLVQMFQSDKGLGRVGENFTRPGDPSIVNVSPQRIREYRRLCATIGAPKCIEGYDATYDRVVTDSSPPPELTDVKDPIFIFIWSRGWTISGDSKGYLYSNAPAFEIVPDLEKTTTRTSKTWVRRIEGPWYLFFAVTN